MRLRSLLAIVLCLSLLAPAGGAGVHARTNATDDSAGMTRATGGCHHDPSAATEIADANDDGSFPTPTRDCCGDTCDCGCLPPAACLFGGSSGSRIAFAQASAAIAPGHAPSSGQPPPLRPPIA